MAIKKINIIIILFASLLLLSLSMVQPVAVSAIEASQAPSYSQEDQLWAEEVLKQSQKLSIENIINHLPESRDNVSPNFREDIITQEELMHKRPELMIFISSSMPEAKLKSYCREATQYGAALILRGLPKGSMITLSKLVNRLTDREQHACPILIDDEAFSYYNISSVPAFILTSSSELDFMEEDAAVAKLFDKLQGSVSLAYAIEEFAGHGDLSKEAADLISKANKVEAAR